MAMAAIGALGSSAISGSSGADGGFLGNIFGYDTNTNTNQTQTQTGTTSTLSDAETQALNSLIGNLTSSNGQYSRASAIADSQGFANKELLNLQQVGLPGIAAQQKTAGAYNSTGALALSQNLEAQTSADVAANTANTISNYANIQNQNNAVLAQLYSILKGATTTINNTGTTSQTVNNNNNGGLVGQSGLPSLKQSGPESGGIPGLVNVIGGGISGLGKIFGF